MKKMTGFTLIEMIIVMVIVGIVAAFSSELLSQGFNAYFTGKSIESITWQAKLALARIALDLRTIASSSDITTTNANQLVFNNINENTVTYQLTGSSLTRNGEVLANGVSAITFSYYDTNGAVTATNSAIRYINYSLTFTLNNVNFSYQSGIFLRNLP